MLLFVLRKRLFKALPLSMMFVDCLNPLRFEILVMGGERCSNSNIITHRLDRNAIRNHACCSQVREPGYWAFSSAGPERSLHTREVTGSNPVMPTKRRQYCRLFRFRKICALYLQCDILIII